MKINASASATLTPPVAALPRSTMAAELGKAVDILNNDQSVFQDKVQAYRQMSNLIIKLTGEPVLPEMEAAEAFINHSSFQKDIEKAAKKFHDPSIRRQNINIATGQTTSVRNTLQYTLDEFNSLSAEEQELVAVSQPFDSVEELKNWWKAQGALSIIEEDAIAAGKYDPLKSNIAIKDPRLSMAVSLIRTAQRINQTPENMKAWTNKAMAFLDKEGLWNKQNPVEDKVDLSETAKAYMRLKEREPHHAISGPHAPQH